MKHAFFALLIFSFSASYSQTGNVKGLVKDISGKPLANAHIYLDKGKQGTVSDANGGFFIGNVPIGVQKVHFSAIGFKTKIEQIDVTV